MAPPPPIVQHVKKTYVSKHILYISLAVVCVLLTILIFEVIETLKVIRRPLKKVSDLAVDVLDLMQLFKDLLRVF